MCCCCIVPVARPQPEKLVLFYLEWKVELITWSLAFLKAPQDIHLYYIPGDQCLILLSVVDMWIDHCEAYYLSTVLPKEF